MEIILNDQNFEHEVLKSDKPVLVDFFAVWCPPCQAMMPLINKFAEDYGDKIKVCKINVDEAPQVSQKYGVQSIPTFIFFKNGQEADRVVGGVPIQTLIEKGKSLFN